MNAGPPFCSVIIVNFNGRHLLDDCLTAVLAQKYPAFEVILIDNGSSDGSAGYVRERFPAVRVVEAGVNLGFAGGNNLGVEQARGAYMVLLNNDTVVAADWLASLAAAAEPDDVACASSLVLTSGIPGRYYEKNGSVNFLCHNIMRVFDRPENIFYGGGASLLFKKAILGIPFDGDYFAYAEDVYLGLRARFKGYRVVHVNGSVVHHIGSMTAKDQKKTFVTYLQERNRILTILIFFSWWTLLRIGPFLAANAAARLLLGLVIPGNSFAGVVRAYWWLLTHPGVIRSKRAVMLAERSVREREVISWMTGKVTNGETAIGRITNAIALGYCRLAGLRTIEFLPPGSR